MKILICLMTLTLSSLVFAGDPNQTPQIDILTIIDNAPNALEEEYGKERAAQLRKKVEAFVDEQIRNEIDKQLSGLTLGQTVVLLGDVTIHSKIIAVDSVHEDEGKFAPIDQGTVVTKGTSVTVLEVYSLPNSTSRAYKVSIDQDNSTGFILLHGTTADGHPNVHR